MPKLFVASGIFHPEAGGPATYLKELLPALQGVGWQPRVLTYGAPQTADYGYPVRRIARGPLPLRRAKYALAAAGSLAWADIVYAQTIDLPLWGRRTVPRVIKVVGDQAWERCVRKRWLPADMGIDAFQTYQGDWRARWQKNARSRQVAAMDAVIVPSQYLKEMVINWGVAPEKIHVIYNALPPLPLSASRAEIRAELNWDQQPTLVTVARLQPWKGIDYLIQALRDLPEIAPGCRWGWAR